MAEHAENLEANLEHVSALSGRIREEVGRVLVGQERLIRNLLIGMLTNGHVLVEGVPGLAKTLAISSLAQAVGGSFARLQFTPDLLPADLIGTTIYEADQHSFSVSHGPVFANLVLADEINRAPAKVQSALLEAMQEHQVTIGGQTFSLPEPFLVMATQNPIEQEGTYPLPEAQIDRFMLKTVISYPSRQQERSVVNRMGHTRVDNSLNQVADPQQLLQARQWLDQVYADQKISDYILDIVFATRPGHRSELSDRQAEADLSALEGLIEYGASPRASLALTLAAKCQAMLQQRTYVVPQDVKDIAVDVLRHRIIPTYEAEAENLTTDNLLHTLLNELRTP